MTVDVQHTERFGLDIAHLIVAGPEDARQHAVDFANEADAAALAREVPEFLQEGFEMLARTCAREQSRDVLAFRFLYVETDVLDLLAEVELEHLGGGIETLFREH